MVIVRHGQSDWADWFKRVDSDRPTNEELRRVLRIASERAVKLGDALVEAGGVDINRGQFLALVEATLG